MAAAFVPSISNRAKDDSERNVFVGSYAVQLSLSLEILEKSDALLVFELVSGEPFDEAIVPMRLLGLCCSQLPSARGLELLVLFSLLQLRAVLFETCTPSIPSSLTAQSESTPYQRR